MVEVAVVDGELAAVVVVAVVVEISSFNGYGSKGLSRPTRIGVSTTVNGFKFSTFKLLKFLIDKMASDN